MSFAPAIEVDGAKRYFVLGLPHDHKTDKTENSKTQKKKRTKGEEFILETHMLQQACYSLVALQFLS